MVLVLHEQLRVARIGDGKQNSHPSASEERNAMLAVYSHAGPTLISNSSCGGLRKGWQLRLSNCR